MPYGANNQVTGSCMKCHVPNPAQMICALVLFPQATILFTVLADVSLWRAAWLTTILFFAYLVTRVITHRSRLVTMTHSLIPDQETQFNVLYLVMLLGLPLAVIGALFYKTAVIRQVALFAWAIFILVPIHLGLNEDLGLSLGSTAVHLVFHHIALFLVFHFGFTWGVPFKLAIGLSLLAAFAFGSMRRQMSSSKLQAWNSSSSSTASQKKGTGRIRR